MSGYSNQNKFLGLLVALLLLGIPAAAQTVGKLPPGKNDSRPPRQPSVRLDILEVTKDDAKAAKDPKTGGRLVPVTIRWRVALSNGAQLVSLNARLITTNTDRSQTRVEQLLPIDGDSSVLSLPMPQGVFAQSFQLEITAGVSLFEGKKSKTISERATKSGNFTSGQVNGAGRK